MDFKSQFFLFGVMCLRQITQKEGWFPLLDVGLGWAEVLPLRLCEAFSK